MIETTMVVFHHHKERTLAVVFRKRPEQRERKLVATYYLPHLDAFGPPQALLQALLEALPERNQDVG